MQLVAQIERLKTGSAHQRMLRRARTRGQGSDDRSESEAVNAAATGGNRGLSSSSVDLYFCGAVVEADGE
jgi:hypothetical protein